MKMGEKRNPLIRVVDMLQLREPVSEFQLGQSVHCFYKFKLFTIVFKIL